MAVMKGPNVLKILDCWALATTSLFKYVWIQSLALSRLIERGLHAMYFMACKFCEFFHTLPTALWHIISHVSQSRYQAGDQLLPANMQIKMEAVRELADESCGGAELKTADQDWHFNQFRHTYLNPQKKLDNQMCLWWFKFSGGRTKRCQATWDHYQGWQISIPTGLADIASARQGRQNVLPNCVHETRQTSQRFLAGNDVVGHISGDMICDGA